MNEEMFYQVACKGILGLRTNVKGFGWSFNQCGTTDSESAYRQCHVRIGLELLSDAELESKFPPCDEATHYSHFQGRPGGDGVFYRRPFSGGRHFLLKAEGLVNGDSLVSANPRYLRYIKIRLMNLHSLNFLLTDLAAFQLLRSGFAAIHCSAFVKGNKTVVLFAPSNTGKTLTVMKACVEQNASFLAEDMAITDGEMVYGVPWTSTFLHYAEADGSLKARLAKRLAGVFPPAALLSLVRHKPITSILKSGTICEKSRATQLVVLERGDDGVCVGDRSEVLRKVLNLNRCEYNYVRSPLLTAYEFLNPTLDVREAFELEASILKRLVETVDECWVVRARDPRMFMSKLDGVLRS